MRDRGAHARLVDHVLWKNISVRVHIGRAEARFVGDRAHDRRPGDRNRTAVNLADPGTGPRSVQGVADFCFSRRRGDLEIKWRIVDPAVDQEFRVTDEATKGVAVQASRRRTPQKSRTPN